jgi:hypothetical protein
MLFGGMTSRGRKWTIALLAITVSAVVAVLIFVGPVRKISEFNRAERVKGYWASLQDFERKHGRYPKDNAEIAAFFHIDAGSEPVVYVPPDEHSEDQVVLWWKQKTVFGVQVGITRSGTIVKR